MKTFRFSLQRVMEWRALQLRSEEEKLAVMTNRLDAVVRNMNALASADLRAERGLQELLVVEGGEFQALPAFQARVKKQYGILDVERRQCEQQITAQRAQLLKARKDFRVLERLKEKRLKTWLYLSDRELEVVAADAYNSKLARARSEE